MTKTRFDSGTKFGKLTVEAHVQRGVRCRCECGKRIVVTESNLLSATISCCATCYHVGKDSDVIRTGDKLITSNGKSMTLAAWARKLRVPYTTLYNRLRAGWSLRRTLTTPKRRFIKRNTP